MTTPRSPPSYKKQLDTWKAKSKLPTLANGAATKAAIPQRSAHKINVSFDQGCSAATMDSTASPRLMMVKPSLLLSPRGLTPRSARLKSADHPGSKRPAVSRSRPRTSAPGMGSRSEAVNRFLTGAGHDGASGKARTLTSSPCSEMKGSLSGSTNRNAGGEMHNDAGASMLSAHTSAPVPPVPVTIKEQGLGVMRSDSNDVWRHANLPLGQHVGSQASMSSPSSFRPPSLTCVDKGPERLKTLLRLSLRASQSPCQSLTTAARMYLPVVEASLDDNGDIRENSNLRDGTRILGKGSFATVYQMILRGGDGVNYALALKVCKVSQLSKVQVTCIERELTIIRAINHSFFLQVFGHWQDSSNFCLLISQAPGGDLFDLLEERQRALGKIDASQHRAYLTRRQPASTLLSWCWRSNICKKKPCIRNASSTVTSKVRMS